MSQRELRTLGITMSTSQVQTVEVNNDANQKNTNMATATTATQVNPFHNVIDLSTDQGKKLYQKANQGLPEEQKHEGDQK